MQTTATQQFRCAFNYQHVVERERGRCPSFYQRSGTAFLSPHRRSPPAAEGLGRSIRSCPLFVLRREPVSSLSGFSSNGGRGERKGKEEAMRRACKRRRGFGGGIVELWNREVGDVSPRSFAHGVAASEDLVLRFGIHKKLNKHRGCVNTVSFNAYGDILVSGSDDRMIVLWNWDAGLVKLSFDSGHSNNVFQAKFMPYTDDHIIVTCAADGEVRHAEICEGGKVSTTLLAQHDGRAHRLAIEPGSPHIFYSSGEDGLVQQFDLRTKSATKLFICKSFPDRSEFQPIVHLNAIAIDPRNPNFFAVAGKDEYARVYDIRKDRWDGSTDCGYPTNCFCPPHLIGDEHVAITGLAFSDQSELLTSYNDELIYLFTKDQGLGPDPVPGSSKTGKVTDTEDGSKPFSSSSPADANRPEPQVYKGHHNNETVKGVSFFGPNCEYVTSGSDCGGIFIWRKRDGKLLRVMEGDRYVVNCIEPHPYVTMIASSGIEKDVKIWTPNALEPVPPVNIDELKRHKRRRRLCQIIFPEDMIAPLLALQRRRSNSPHHGEDGEGNVDLVDRIMHFTGGDDSSDENGDSTGHPGDCMVN